MPRDYKHPYDRKKRPSEIERPEMPEWLRGTHSCRKRLGKSLHSYKYWKRMFWATPPWLTDEHILEMVNLYLDAPSGYEVDHIIPLNHPYVCGLNVPWNLRLIPRKENSIKSNNCFHYLKNFEQGALFDERTII